MNNKKFTLSSKAKTRIVVFSAIAGTAIAVSIILAVLLIKKHEPTVNEVKVDKTYVPEKIMGSWSYYKSGFTQPWSSDDFFYYNAGGRKALWQNVLLSDSFGSWDFYAEKWTDISEKANIEMLIFWSSSGGITSEATLEVWDANYKSLRERFPKLPEHPSGMLVYDEPNFTGIFGDDTRWGLVTSTQKIKEKYPGILLYCNFRYDSITSDISKIIGNSELDYISSDQYYDISVNTYRNTYNTILYPNIKPTQKVLLLPFAAYYEISTPNTVINPTTADNACLNTMPPSAVNYKNWMDTDPRIYGMVIYRLKNLWWPNTSGKSILSNPNGTGLGLVDRVSVGGDYVMPNTVKFYQELGGNFSEGILAIK